MQIIAVLFIFTMFLVYFQFGVNSLYLVCFVSVFVLFIIFFRSSNCLFLNNSCGNDLEHFKLTLSGWYLFVNHSILSNTFWAILHFYNMSTNLPIHLHPATWRARKSQLQLMVVSELAQGSDLEYHFT